MHRADRSLGPPWKRSAYRKANLAPFHAMDGFAGRPLVEMTITTLGQNNLLSETSPT